MSQYCQENAEAPSSYCVALQNVVRNTAQILYTEFERVSSAEITIECIHGLVSVFLGVKMNKRVVPDFLDSLNGSMAGEDLFYGALCGTQHQVPDVQHLHLKWPAQCHSSR